MENAAACGSTWREWFAMLDQSGSLWRTRQCSLFGGLTEFSGTWPRWGMMRDGECFPLPMLAHDTSVITLIVNATTDEVGTLTGKLGMIDGVSVKSAMSKVSVAGKK